MDFPTLSLIETRRDEGGAGHVHSRPLRVNAQNLNILLSIARAETRDPRPGVAAVGAPVHSPDLGPCPDRAAVSRIPVDTPDFLAPPSVTAGAPSSAPCRPPGRVPFRPYRQTGPGGSGIERLGAGRSLGPRFIPSYSAQVSRGLVNSPGGCPDRLPRCRARLGTGQPVSGPGPCVLRNPGRSCNRSARPAE